MGKRISFDFEQFIAVCSFMDDSDCGEFFKMVKAQTMGEPIDFNMCENISNLAYAMADVKVEEGEGK